MSHVDALTRGHALRLVALTSLMTLASAGCMRNPITGRSELILVDDAQAAQQGRTVFNEYLRKIPRSRNVTATRLVEQVVHRLATCGDPNLRAFPWNVVLFESNQLNAFALPGGHVGVYTGILPVAANEAGLAAILGHEMGHVVARHSAEDLTRSMVLDKGVGIIQDTVLKSKVKTSKNRDEIMQGGAVALDLLVQKPFSRAQETEADEMGHNFMACAGYDPHEAPNVWRRMIQAGAGNGVELLSTHPDPQNRIAALMQGLSKVIPIYQRAPRKYGIGVRF